MSNNDSALIEAMASRLKGARSKIFASAEVAAQSLGLVSSTVRAHENGQNGYPYSDAINYARAYGVPLEWLITGKHAEELQFEIAEYVAVEPQDFTSRVLDAMVAKGLNQRQLASKAGVNHHAIGNLIRGRTSMIMADTAVAVARALGTTVEYLVDGTPPSALDRQARLELIAEEIYQSRQDTDEILALVQKKERGAR